MGSHGFGNGQMEYNTSRAKNSYIDNGSLVIEAFREDYFGSSFTSARLNTHSRLHLSMVHRGTDTASGHR